MAYSQQQGLVAGLALAQQVVAVAQHLLMTED
jgi:hypothetical protein